ncbi:hypothetical protein [Kribbella kalugense]|uniref:Uncharacterized protein n=1 Tax=Kribbella kalugense TaxID=2512221 RepID=A0A4R7ZCU8_9ACTN|nr:hypothetical protein [Kribbella kalugense]TDW15022.1 hypothetical protein EV650_6502 [Kribbella kalugense]
MEPELDEPSPLELSSELEPLELEFESSELLEVAVVPELLECFDETTATEIPVAPTPRTAVAMAAADARCNQRRRVEAASEVTMRQDSPQAPQPHSKRRSSHRQVLLKAV